MNLYVNLLAQATKLYRHNRQGSYKTRERYFEAYKRFLRYLALTFHAQKIANISEKHVCAYVAHMREKGYSPSTIKTDLAAIRFWHDQIPNAKYTLPDNITLALTRRRFGEIDRTWSTAEFHRMIAMCWRAGQPDFEACFVLARYAGLRLHETIRIDTAMAKEALKTDILTIKGKGGKVREVPINQSVRIELERALTMTPLGQKLFVPAGKQSHETHKDLQAFIRRHREVVQDPGSTRPMTYHGLRHTYAVEQYEKLLSEGKSDFSAKQIVSKLLGHERADVTGIYLAHLKKQPHQHKKQEGLGIVEVDLGNNSIEEGD